ncbi:MAG: leucyl aminopeptidase, partial [Litorivivens sp.]
MQFLTKTANITKSRSQCIVVGLYDDKSLTPSAEIIDAASKGYLKKVIGRGDIEGKLGQSVLLHDVAGISAPRVMLVGLGNAGTADGPKFIKLMQTLIAVLKNVPAKNTLCCLLEASAGDKDIYWKTRRLVEQFVAG